MSGAERIDDVVLDPPVCGGIESPNSQNCLSILDKSIARRKFLLTSNALFQSLKTERRFTMPVINTLLGIILTPFAMLVGLLGAGSITLVA